jgi:hypothetical protein
MAEYGLFHAERARRQALSDRGEVAADLTPWPLARWRRDEEDEYGDTFVARDEGGAELCRVEFWFDPRETDEPREPAEDGRECVAVAEVTFAGEEDSQMIDLYEETPEEIEALSEGDFVIAAREAKRIVAANEEAMLQYWRAAKEQHGEEIRGCLDDPDPRYDGFRRAERMERERAERPMRN